MPARLQEAVHKVEELLAKQKMTLMFWDHIDPELRKLIINDARLAYEILVLLREEVDSRRSRDGS